MHVAHNIFLLDGAEIQLSLDKKTNRNGDMSFLFHKVLAGY